MSGLLLQIILSNKKTVKATLDYCKDRSICRNNKNILSKKLLSVSGYKSIPSGTNVVEIYNELAILSAKKSLAEKADAENFIKMTEGFKTIIAKHGSQQLKNFLSANGIILPVYTSRLDTLKKGILDTKSRLENIYNQNPELVQRAISLYPSIVGSLKGPDHVPRKQYPKSPKPKRKVSKTSRK